jgi:4-hydroxy-tetrahydrodipicolinate synthase
MAGKGLSRNEAKPLMRGVVNIQFTPFKSATEIDEEALRDNTRFMIEEGIVKGKGVQVIGGSNGEGFNLSDEEYGQLIEIVVDEAKGRVPIVVGCVRPGTIQVIKIAKMAEEAGADGIMVLAPFYYSNAPDDLVYQHFKAIADATEIGIMIYNNHAVTGKDMSIDCLMRLAEIDHIVALKEITPNIFKLREVAHRLGDRFTLNANTYRTLAPLDYQFGVVGHNNFIANYDPKAALEVDANDASGDFEKCQAWWVRNLPLVKYVFRGDMYRMTAFGKEMARIMGRPMGDFERIPLQRPTEAERKKLRELMIEVGMSVK